MLRTSFSQHVMYDDYTHTIPELHITQVNIVYLVFYVSTLVLKNVTQNTNICNSDTSQQLLLLLKAPSQLKIIIV